MAAAADFDVREEEEEEEERSRTGGPPGVTVAPGTSSRTVAAGHFTEGACHDGDGFGLLFKPAGKKSVPPTDSVVGTDRSPGAPSGVAHEGAESKETLSPAVMRPMNPVRARFAVRGFMERLKKGMAKPSPDCIEIPTPISEKAHLSGPTQHLGICVWQANIEKWNRYTPSRQAKT